MNNKRSRTMALAATACLTAAGLAFTPAMAHTSGSNFVKVKSAHGFTATVNALQSDIKSDGLMVMGQVNQGRILSITGLRLKGARSFFVGNPRVGKKLFSVTPAVAAVVPARISVWSSHKTTYIGYFKPSSLMDAVSSHLAKPGKILDARLKKIVHEAAH